MIKILVTLKKPCAKESCLKCSYFLEINKYHRYLSENRYRSEDLQFFLFDNDKVTICRRGTILEMISSYIPTHT